MLRMLLVAQMGVALAVVALGDDPKPQWQRLLTGTDAQQADDLDKRIEELEAADNYAEAIRRQEELLALRTRVQGADHWQTVNEKWDLAAMKKVAALAPDRRAGWRQAADSAATAWRLTEQAQYGKALPLRLEGLKWFREVLGEDHPFTAQSYNNVALNLNGQAQYAEAALLYQKALDIQRKVVGEVHPSTATTYYNLANNLQDQGKYGEAMPLLQKALDIERNALGEDHRSTAHSFNSVAYNLNARGKYAEAGPLFQKALDIFRKVLGEDHASTAMSYNNVAYNQQKQGKYVEAGRLYAKALGIRRRVLGEDSPNTANSYNNLAGNLQAQGKLAEAEPLYQKALDIHRKAFGEEHPYTAQSYDNTASNLYRQGKFADAGPMHQKALDIQRRILGEVHPHTALSYNNVAANLQRQGKYAEAGLLYQKALDIQREVLGEYHPKTTVSYHNIASNLQAEAKYPEALAALETAARSYEAARLSVADGGLERAAFGAEQSPYPFLAAARSRAGRTADAWSALEADLARGLLDEMTLRPGVGLTPPEQRQRDELRARQTPLDARVLALASRLQRTDAETAELKRLGNQRQQLDEAVAKLAVAVSQREVAALVPFQATLAADAAFVAWVDVGNQSAGVQEHWACLVRPHGDPHWERLRGSGPEGSWTSDDTELPGQFHAALAKSAPVAVVDALAKKLLAQRLAPLRIHLDGVKRLFVAPVDKMAGIPIEALTDEYTVSYTPSCTYLARLKDREPRRSNGLLAVGDPVFPPRKAVPPPTALPPGGLLITQVLPGGAAANARLQSGDVLVAYAGQNLASFEQLTKLVAANATEKTVVATVWREGQEKLTERELASGRLGVALAKEPAREAITARRQADQMLAKLMRGEDYAELPGTQVEIARLAELFDPKDVTTLTRAAASEQRLDELRRADKLKQFRYLHFATHGKANNVAFFESALLLTPPALLPEVRVGEPYLEGRLTAGEVLEYWKLDAELVTLSACESGLGRKGGGDGLLGFAQAFLKAGSRSVCLTLWQVDDTATALLMDRFYRNLLGKGPEGKALGKAAALREAKDWLRTVTAGEALERLGTLTQGVVRGERPAHDEMAAVPTPNDAGKDYRPYAHPRYWAAFILIGDPD